MTKLEEKIAIMKAALDGTPIEYRPIYHSSTTAEWQSIAEPLWNWTDCDYRVAPDKPDEINWSHVAGEFKYMARDKNGACWLYTERPAIQPALDSWGPGDGECERAELFASLQRGSTPWDQSLVARPGIEL